MCDEWREGEHASCVCGRDEEEVCIALSAIREAPLRSRREEQAARDSHTASIVCHPSNPSLSSLSPFHHPCISASLFQSADKIGVGYRVDSIDQNITGERNNLE